MKTILLWYLGAFFVTIIVFRKWNKDMGPAPKPMNIGQYINIFGILLFATIAWGTVAGAIIIWIFQFINTGTLT